jgi:beta-glucosidase-like glycosyl hydrolase
MCFVQIRQARALGLTINTVNWSDENHGGHSRSSLQTPESIAFAAASDRRKGRLNNAAWESDSTMFVATDAADDGRLPHVAVAWKMAPD